MSERETLYPSADQSAEPQIVTPHEPDQMGVWDEDAETIWLPVTHYPKRIDAIRFVMHEWAVPLPEVRCRVRWMAYKPFTAYNLDGSVAWSEDQWFECEKTEPGAFKVWRLEAA